MRELEVIERFKAGPNHPETGWVCGEVFDDETKALREHLQRRTGMPWDEFTVIEDGNWDGPVWVGGRVVVSSAPSGNGQRTMFRCVRVVKRGSA